MKVQFLLLWSHILASFSYDNVSDISERNNDHRRMFVVPLAYDFYDNRCCTDLTNKFQNPCPQIHACYEADNCNKCCQGGASSLKLKWHGKCGGDFTLNTHSLHGCKTDVKGDTGKGDPMFVDCHCYDYFLKTIHKNIPFDCFLNSTRYIAEDETEADICIVSVNKDGNVDFNTNLTNPLRLTNSIDGGEMTITHFDVSCLAGLPIYPGYAKFVNTCSMDGFIDLPGGLNMTDEISHLDGAPLIDMSWYEFIDGTSSGFWPDSNKINVFDPTFSICDCVGCPSIEPTSVITSMPYQESTGSLTFRPTITRPSTTPTFTVIPTPTVAPEVFPTLSNFPAPTLTSKPIQKGSEKPTTVQTLNPTSFPSVGSSKFPAAPPLQTLDPTILTCDGATICSTYAHKYCFKLTTSGHTACYPNEDTRKLVESEMKMIPEKIAYRGEKINERPKW